VNPLTAAGPMSAGYVRWRKNGTAIAWKPCFPDLELTDDEKFCQDWIGRETFEELNAHEHKVIANRWQSLFGLRDWVF